MNIFAPYLVEKDSPVGLQLADSPLHRSLLFIVTRIFPILFVIGACLVIFYGQNKMPGQLMVLFMITTCTVAIILLFKKNTLEVSMDRTGFTIVYQMLYSKQEVYILMSDVDHIRFRIRHGKGGGLFYSIVMKTGEKHPLFKISLLFMNRERQLLINEKLQAITGLTVIKK